MDTRSKALTNEVMGLRAIVSAVPDPEPGELPDEQAHQELVELMQARSALEAKIAHRAAQWRINGYWANDGSRSAEGRLARESGCAPPTAKRLLSLGRAVGDMPSTQTAWRDGRLSTDKVALLAAAHTPKRAELFSRDEALLVTECSRFRYSQAVKIVEKWKKLADRVVDPDGTPPMPETYVKASVTYGGAVAVDAMLDPVGGEMFREQLDRIERELSQADRAAGRQRTTSERRAAALVEMALRAGTAPKDGKRPEPLICIVAGERSLADICESLAGTTLHPTLAGPYLTDAQVQSFIYDGVHDITGASRVRSFRGTLRRALQVRDRHCQHPSGCDIPATRCDGDHYPVTYGAGGDTSMANGRMMCDRHNRNAALRDLSPAEPVLNHQPELLEPPPPSESPPESPPESPADPVPLGDDRRELVIAAPDPNRPQLHLTPEVAPARVAARAPDAVFGDQSVWLDHALAA